MISRTEELSEKPLLTITETAELLGIAETTVDNLHRAKVLPAVRVGRCRMWKPDDVWGYVQGLTPES